MHARCVVVVPVNSWSSHAWQRGAVGDCLKDERMRGRSGQRATNMLGLLLLVALTLRPTEAASSPASPGPASCTVQVERAYRTVLGHTAVAIFSNTVGQYQSEIPSATVRVSFSELPCGADYIATFEWHAPWSPLSVELPVGPIAQISLKCSAGKATLSVTDTARRTLTRKMDGQPLYVVVLGLHESGHTIPSVVSSLQPPCSARSHGSTLVQDHVLDGQDGPQLVRDSNIYSILLPPGGFGGAILTK